MELTIGAARAGSAAALADGSGWTRAVSADGSGWTRCARQLAVGVVAFATVASGVAMTAKVVAAAPARPESVIVRGAGSACTAQVASAITQLGGTVTRSLGILGGAAATVGSDRIAALRSNPCVAAVTADGAVSLSSIGSYDPTADTGSLFNTTSITGAQSAWKAGYTGKGVSVALIDSGVSPVQGLNNGQLVNGPDISFDSQSPSLVSLDGFGHGTHMAGIIAGNDGTLPAAAYAGNTSQFVGMAPDARIVNVKVADAHGASDVSQIIAGIDWVVQHRNDSGLNIKVLNLSFGTDSLQPYQADPLAYAAEQAWKAGIVVVVAAGNGGAASAALTDPATDPFVIAVGAADTQSTNSTADDTVASFSSSGSATRSPDLVAPGVHIEGLRDPGSFVDTLFGSTATVADRFFLGSGTSQATAVVSGAAALLEQKNGGLTPNQIKYQLTSTATPLVAQPASRQGHGELNVAAALNAKAPGGAARQSFPASNGLGTLDGSRGSVHLIANGVSLGGEQDIMGSGWSSAAMATAEASQAAWAGGTFNGSGWSGSGWSGSGWSGSGWSGSGWSGSGWSGSGWSGSGWSGSGWSGSGWSGNTWTGSGWSGSGWSGSGWSGSGWSGSGWSGSGWSGSGWSGSGWSGSGWSGSGWSGSGWSGSGWSGSGWSGSGWSGADWN